MGALSGGDRRSVDGISRTRQLGPAVAAKARPATAPAREGRDRAEPRTSAWLFLFLFALFIRGLDGGGRVLLVEVLDHREAHPDQVAGAVGDVLGGQVVLG